MPRTSPSPAIDGALRAVHPVPHPGRSLIRPWCPDQPDLSREPTLRFVENALAMFTPYWQKKSIMESVNSINFQFRREVLEGRTRIGTFLNTGSAVAVELAAQSGLDWILIDLEHGMGDWDRLPSLLMATTDRGAVPVVRLPQLRQEYFKRAFDMGALGVMVPYVETAQQAADAVRFSRYPPRGVRGVAKFNRAARFGTRFPEWLERSHEATLVVVQIETARGVENAEAIAAVEGVDVLFVGPMDLTVSLGIPQQFGHPDFLAAKSQVVGAARKAGKAPGILGLDLEQIPQLAAEGFNFLAVGSDGGYLSQAFANLVQRGSAVRD